jgi:eukaryotic-like serine/threonine-protein kinase
MLESVGHYRILENIGSGGMGDLYRARDTRVGRTVALRVVAPGIAGDPARLEQFLRDARVSASVSHPNIAAIYEVGEEGGHHYLACEFIQGQRLKSLISGRPLNARRAIDLTIQVADALADACASEVVHGDLRTDTILINAKGNVKLLDFGLARWASRSSVDGQPALHEASAGDHEDDIAALGAVLYEMLTGHPPQRDAEPAVDAHVSDEFDAIVRRARSALPGERYQTSATLAADLREVAAALDARAKTGGQAAVAPSAGARRHTTMVWLTVLAIAALLAWLIWTASKMR